MAYQFVEEYRSSAMKQVKGMKGFAACWPVWEKEILKLTKNVRSADAIYQLGGNLRHVFKLTAQSGRSQGDLSGGGAAWEGLVCWYVNLILRGTRAVAVKHSKKLVPMPVADAMSVNYSATQTNTESDLVGISLPEDQTLHGSFSKTALDELVGANMGKTDVHNIQCKTNWNDNAQIPMLWDMIYRAKGFKDSGVSVGRNGRSIGDLNDFTYSFVTMPSQNVAFTPKSMSVKRVAGLSGGNFWGQPTDAGVAWSISEVFKRLYGDKVIGDVRSHIQVSIQNGLISPHNL